jgi:hypothetical protein
MFSFIGPLALLSVLIFVLSARCVYGGFFFLVLECCFLVLHNLLCLAFMTVFYEVPAMFESVLSAFRQFYKF